MNISSPQRIFIAGGTGFLGYAALQEFLRLGHQVVTIALENEMDTTSLFDARVEVHFGNLFTMTEDALFQLFSQSRCERLVYALGPDDRVIPDGSAWPFFYHRLVEKACYIIAIAKRAGIKHAVILNSYFSYFDRQFAGKLAKKHPYIRARVAQEEVISKLNETGIFSTCFLELPYIFGLMKGRKSIWREALLDRIDVYPYLFFPRGGGTAMIDVLDVGRAMVAATLFGEANGRYFVGEENLTYREFLTIIQEVRGSKKKLIMLPAWLVAIGAKSLERKHHKEGKESGLSYPWLMKQILAKKFYFTHQDYKTILHYDELGYVGHVDVRQSIKETIASCYPESKK